MPVLATRYFNRIIVRKRPKGAASEVRFHTVQSRAAPLRHIHSCRHVCADRCRSFGHQQRRWPVGSRLANLVRLSLQNSANGGRGSIRTHPSHGGGVCRSAHDCSRNLDIASGSPSLDENSWSRCSGHRGRTRYPGRNHRALLSSTGYFVCSCRAGADFVLYRSCDRALHRPQMGRRSASG